MHLPIKNKSFSHPSFPFLVFLGAVSTAVVLAVLIFNQISSATSLANWNPGRIIDDSVMTNANSMNVSQIQSFLNAKSPACDTNGLQNSEMNNAGVPDYNGNGSIQRWEWGKAKYNQTKFVCLKDYKQNNVSAAQLIYNAAHTYTINPRVLIVLLQKEQGLVTDTWPLNIQYRSATGYGCPDTAACDSQYYGLTNQLNWAARMFRSIMDANPNWYTPYILGKNYIRYNPNSACGGSTVNILNRATQALYNYTPYQPNTAALQAGYGGGNSCSSYGNRNFYLYFNDWFGASIGTPTFSWSLVSREAYSNSAYTTKYGDASIEMEPASDMYLKMVVRNTGNQTWYQQFARLALVSTPIFNNDSWLSPTRAAVMQEDSVMPGQTATFLFKVASPPELGMYRQTFALLLEGQRWFPGSFAYDINVASDNPYYYVSALRLDLYGDAQKKYPLNPARILAYKGLKLYGNLTFKNTGNQTLPATTTKLAPTNPNGRASTFHDDTWLSTTRIANPKQGAVAPGATGVFEFVLMPSADGTFTEQIGVVVEGVRWINVDMGSIGLISRDRFSSMLKTGNTLTRGQEIVSNNGLYRLAFQNDGNLVLYSQKRILWLSRTNGKNAVRLTMQNDGNLVIYNSRSQPIWQTRKSGQGPSYLKMADDGNVLVYKNTSGPTWQLRTNGLW